MVSHQGQFDRLVILPPKKNPGLINLIKYTPLILVTVR